MNLKLLIMITMFTQFVVAGECNLSQNMLYTAILSDAIEEIEQALEAGADINNGKDNKAPLLWAIVLKKSNSVKALIANGANINITYLGQPLIHHALKLGDIESALWLTKNGAPFSGYVDVTKKNVMDYVLRFVESPPMDASGKHTPKKLILELLQELINHGYSITNDYWLSNVWYAAITHEGRREDALKIFLKDKANPNQIIDTDTRARGTSWTPLLIAVRFGNKEAIRILLEAGADINQKATPIYKGGSHSPLSYALTEPGKSHMVEFLLEHGASL